MQTLKLTKKYEKYPEYKDSGIEWLGKIPKGWDVGSSRELFQTKKELASETDSQKVLSLTLRGVVPRVLDGSGKNPANYDMYQEFQKDDLVFCLFDYDVTPRTIGYVEENGMMTGAYTRLIPKNKTFSKFYYYYFLYLDYSKELLHLCTGLRNSISKPVFWSMKSPLPLKEEQEKIVAYLDEKTALIDQVIEKKKKLIELLREKRTAVINHAVTKGLDPKAELIESGIDWVGKIPKGWKILPLFSIARENYLKNSMLQNSKLLSLSRGRVVTKNIESNFGLLPQSFDAYQIVKDGYVVLRLTDLQNDKTSLRVGHVEEIGTGIITSAYSALIFNDTLNSKYAYYLLNSYDICKVFYAMGGGVRQSIDFRHIKHLPFLLPSFEDQNVVVRLLDSINKEHDFVIKKAEQSIIFLQEFKSSLISHAVTGKIKI